MADLLDRLKAALADRYRIERELGSGGMATVYLAHDLKHDRKVAIKVMRPELSAILGGERFLREVQIAAKLNHPHILALYDSGEAEEFLYYVMPHVEGESLRAKLNREKQLSVDEAISITKQVGAALDYAHEQGVIHRDIKPENILMYQGEALVADFGIALAVTAAGGTRLTDTGLSLGTPEYMSPEQATGERELDARSDMYSLGAITYEMLVGEPPHTGNTVQAIIAKVVSAEPQPVSRVRHSVPSNVNAAVMCALAKTPADRFDSGEDYAEALTDPAFSLPTTVATTTLLQREGHWNRLSIGLAALAALLAVLALWGWLRSPAETPQSVTRFSIQMLEGQEVVDGGGSDIAISPDGTRLVYYGPSETMWRLWTRPLDSLHARPLRQTEEAYSAVFSPDGEHVAFYQAGALKVASISGSAAEMIVDSIRRFCLDWAPDGMLYFGSGNGGISRVMATGGEPEVLTTPDTSSGELHNGVHVLPNGAGALFVRWKGQWDDADIAVLDLHSREVHALVSGGHPTYSESGHLLYVQSDSTLMAVPFDQDRMVVHGQATALVDGVALTAYGVAEYTLSETGSLLYGTATDVPRQPVWVDRVGTEQVIDPDWPPMYLYQLALSPDDSRLAFSAEGSEGRQIWIKVLDRGPLQRLTFEGSYNSMPIWTPDGRFVTFGSLRTGEIRTIWQKRADGSRSAFQLSDLGVSANPNAWSPDGQWLIIASDFATNRDIYAIRPELDSVAVPLVVGEFSMERSAVLSPDGRLLAYSSDLTGTPQVYVRPFPDMDVSGWQVSMAGGTEPNWAQNGRELFYVNGNREMVVVHVETSLTFRRLSERVLFSVAGYAFPLRQRNYDVSHDDQRFVMMKQIGESRNEVIVVLNFFEELKQRVGNGND